MEDQCSIATRIHLHSSSNSRIHRIMSSVCVHIQALFLCLQANVPSLQGVCSGLPFPFSFVLDRFILADGFAVFHRNLSLVCSHFLAFPKYSKKRNRGWGGNGQLVFSGYKVSTGEDEKVWETNSSDSYTTVGVY